MELTKKPWLDKSIASNDQAVCENFKEWMGSSRVAQRVYHATASHFDAFDTTKGDLGPHFGNLSQMSFLESRIDINGGAPMVIMPIWLSIKNPLRLKDMGSFHANGIALQLERKGLLPRGGEGKAIFKACDKDWRQRKLHDPNLKSLIQGAGYDGVVYANAHEGSGDSYIALDPRQIKSAVGNSGLYIKGGSSPCGSGK